ncbi:hypothetical protein ACLKA6_001077, partial [Drosophila palustris]
MESNSEFALRMCIPCPCAPERWEDCAAGQALREKQCVRDLRITLAMRRAFVRKFGREEEIVEKTQLFFRGAQDEARKKAQYAAMRNQ